MTRHSGDSAFFGFIHAAQHEQLPFLFSLLP